MKTFMLYLNDDFEGATTNFIDDTQGLYKNEEGKFVAEDKNILYRLKPKKGMALVFNHGLLHEGGVLQSGFKYIMRTEVMYNREVAPELTDNQKEGLDIWHKAQLAETNGELDDAVKYYTRAYRLFPELEFA